MTRPSPAKKNQSRPLSVHLPELAAQLNHVEHSAGLGKAIKTVRQESIARFMEHSRRGDVIARKISGLQDEAIAGLFASVTQLYPVEAQHLAIVAVGGYGRSFLAPYSDIDLLFLHGSYAQQKIKPVLDYLLYAMWDAGLQVSQSVHSPASAINFIKEDLPGKTSFLDARFLHGNRSVFDEFWARFDKHREQTISEFVEAKLLEREARLRDDLQSRYSIEPNIKEGKGGIRDLQLLHWLAKYAYGTPSLEDHTGVGVFTPEEAASFRKIVRFLWSVRIQLHDLRGRADEMLSFDIQPAIAVRLGYQGRGRVPATERLMKHYFINAAEVGRLTGVISSALESANMKKSRLLMATFMDLPRRFGKNPLGGNIRADELGAASAFRLNGHRLDFRPDINLDKAPVEMLRLFRLAGRKPACEIHPDALKKVDLHNRALDRKVIRTPELATVFKAIIEDTEKPESVLRDMSEAGLLGRYIPIFGRLIGRVKYGLYRAYTLDEHVLKAVGVLVDLARGRVAKEHPLSDGILTQANDLMSFFLSVFMSEMVEALPHLGKEQVAAEIKKSIKHLVADESQIDDIVWVATNHRLLVDTAVSRNISATETVSRFCELVGSRQRLDYMLIVTVCSLRVIGFNSWDQWTRRDLSVLYNAARAWFESGEDGLEAITQQRKETLRNKVARRLQDWSVPELDRFFQRMPPAFSDSVNPDSATRFAQLVKAADKSTPAGVVNLHVTENGAYELMVYSRDRPGLFAAIAGTIASVGGLVRAATAFPVAPASKGLDMAANIFVFQDNPDQPLATPGSDAVSLQGLEERFSETVNGDLKVNLRFMQRIGDRTNGFTVEPDIMIDEVHSEDCLIVEARGLDRPGLLYDLSSALAEISVSIRSAYIASYGELAVDTFYVQDLSGTKIEDRKRQQEIRKKLLGILQHSPRDD